MFTIYIIEGTDYFYSSIKSKDLMFLYPKSSFSPSKTGHPSIPRKYVSVPADKAAIGGYIILILLNKSLVVV